jgi:hypothetical protein
LQRGEVDMMPFQGRDLGIFPGRNGVLFTTALLCELDQ